MNYRTFREASPLPKEGVVLNSSLVLLASHRGRIAVWLLFTSLVVSPNRLGGYLFSYDRVTTATTDGSTEASNALREIIASGQLTDLRWPNFSDYRSHLQNFYGPTSYGLAWLHAGRPTPQALTIIEVLERADQNGLHAEDYDGTRWTERLTRLRQPEDLAHFDAALSVCLMRYISDLRIGKVNPQHFGFGLSVENKKYDLPQFVRNRLVTSNDISAALEEVEPPFPGYKRTVIALRHYLEISSEDDGQKLPVPSKPVEPGSQYAGVSRLTDLLRLLGDLPADAGAASDDIYQGALVDAVKRFQQRHGLVSDGRLGAQTLKQLNTPLSARVEQLRLTLERWRWVPPSFPQPPVVVNIPEFRLRTFDDNGNPVLTMNVIVGKAFRHETPVFEKDMRFIVFRPYWNVPPSIQRSELVPAIQRNRKYVADRNYEVVTQSGEVVAAGVISDEVLNELRAGKLAIRQKPGPQNALGLVKLMFPNEHNVYLHSTPSQQLFAQSRRDFSHGCIRVEKPDELAAWALRNNPGWSLERVRAAMQGSQDNLQVNLAKPIPVLILYGTAVVDEQGIVHFFDDLYGHDASLARVLAKGYPYPG
jgi:L,D-transpeptidase YcbB